MKILVETKEKIRDCCSNQVQMYLEEEQAALQSVNKEIVGANFRAVGLIRNKNKTKRLSSSV